MTRIIHLCLLFISLVQLAQAFQQQDPLYTVLLLNKQNYYAAEPLNVTTILYNKGESPVNILKIDHKVFYRRLDQPFILYKTLNELLGGSTSSINKPFELKPNENIGRESYLLYNINNNQFVLEEAGKYEIRSIITIVFPNGNSKEYKSSSTIVVSEPLNKDKLALQELKKLHLGQFLTGALPHNIIYEDLENVLETAMRFIEKHTESNYSFLVAKELDKNLQKIIAEGEDNLSPKIKSIHERLRLIDLSKSKH